MAHPKPLATLLLHRGAFTQLLASAALLALGVSLFASAVSNSLQPWALWLISISILLISIYWIAKQTIPSRDIKQDLEGFVLVNPENSKVISVPRYRFSYRLNSYIVGLFAENSAIKDLFVNDPIHKSFEIDAKTRTAKLRVTEAGRLVIEATEYYILETLSSHLTDYFNKQDLDSDGLQELVRNDLGQIVLSNRFLDTFSRPMQERSVFGMSGKLGNSDKVVSSFGPNGVLYSRFDLTLPVGATVKRYSPTSIIIATPKFDLSFKIMFQGTNTNLPPNFSELYLDGTSSGSDTVYEIKISTSVKFKLGALLSRSGWEYHAWLDSFLSRLESEFSMEAFLENIKWESAVTVSRVVKSILSSEKDAIGTATPDKPESPETPSQ